MHALFFQCSDDPFDHPVLLRDDYHKRSGVDTRPDVPNQVINACSKAISAVLALPERDKYQPNSYRVWHSITKTNTI